MSRMTHLSHWTTPADRMVRGGMGRCDITILQPPFVTATAHGLPANDPVQARELARSFGTVEEVLEEIGTRPAHPPLYLVERSDLDQIQAGAWGPVLGISDPALGDDGNDTPLLYEVGRLRERYPDARIVGRVEVDCGESHTEDIVWLPDGTMFHASGWPGMDPWEVTGDPHAVAAALGVTGDILAEIDVDLDAEPEEVEWSAFVGLALGEADPWPWTHLETSVLRVRHTESHTRRMEKLYFLGS
ncbi:hypothetical protein JK360_01835 [Streptomyces sp. 9-7]|uniref:Uncharacterized protein n=2 Tax=Streptomyces TaxID=1883 RepID=A0ABS1MJA7_9ACTN|nr:hypothetical protein [Streptomyces sp. 9-7]